MMSTTTSQPVLPFLDSTPLLGDTEALQARVAEEGYLFFRQLLPADDVLAARNDVLSTLQPFGWFKDEQDETGGLLDREALNRLPAEQMRLDIGVSTEAYHTVQKLESFHRLPHHPRLIALYETLFNSEVLVHSRHILRLVTPHPAMVPTPRHQDFPLIRGTSQFWTCWFPLGPCPQEQGSLTVLRGSNRLGYVPFESAAGAGGLAAQLCPGEVDWAGGDFETGDVLTFPCYTIHRALPDQLKNRIRISMDVRYQPAHEPVEEGSLQPHCALTWEEIYQNWSSDEFKYYWHKQALEIVGRDDSFPQPERRIC
jgi:hypothetical protein